MTTFVVLFAALGLEPALGQTSGGTTDTAKPADKFIAMRGEWHRVGVGFACVVKSREQVSPDPDSITEALRRACLHIGPLVIGQDAQDVEAALGAPHRTLARRAGEDWVYFLEATDTYPYLVATVAKDRLVALQITGPVAAKDGYEFNHIDLGATVDLLVRYFGQPSHVEPSEKKDTELWTYDPWPFSFEVKDDHVTSIRIFEPN